MMNVVVGPKIQYIKRFYLRNERKKYTKKPFVILELLNKYMWQDLVG